MVSSFTRRAAVVLALIASAGCTIHNTETPAVSGPSTLALSLSLNAIPDSISQDGGSQSAIRITAIGPNGKGVPALPLRIDTRVNGVPQDYGTLSARTVVTNSDGVATVVYTAPPSPADGAFGQCGSLVGNCVDIIATPTGTDFSTAVSQSVRIRLVPLGVILAPASTPTAVFTYSPTAVSANLPINFDASSSQPGSTTGQIVSYNWTFGDGTTGTGRTVTHTYASGNNFAVTLTVTNDRGLSASSTQQLGVGSGALPTPSFTFSPQAPAVNEPVFFNASTSTPGVGHTSITSYRWSFGDGSTGSGQTVSHAYTAAGTYIVQLTVTDESGQSNTSTGTSITLGGGPAPTANFTFSPTSPNVGDTVVFDWRTSTTQQGLRIVSLDWNFGDSTPVVRCPGNAACTSDGITTHVFPRAGIFTVNLVVTDSAGRTNARSQTVTVATGSPTAVVTLTKSGGLSVQADGSTSSASGGAAITAYTFFWGDGSSTSGASPSATHTYTLTGTYSVTLRVTDSLNRTGNSPAQTVTVP